MRPSLPPQIKQNPEISVPVKGIRGWKVGGPDGLVVFFEIEQGTALPEHSHCFQWGLIIEGELEFTIGGERRVYRKGDAYTIPEGVPHSGRFNLPTLAMDFFSDPRRY